MKEIITELKSDCHKSLEHLKTDLNKIRTGRASASLLETIDVDYYGSQTPLQQLGLISAPEARMLTVQVYDASAVDAVEKAIQQSGLGLNPSKDGGMIRVPIPALTEERRREIVKLLGKTAEDSKVAMRNHRRTAIDGLKAAKDDKAITEDEQKRYETEVQTITDEHIKSIDEQMSLKEQEIMAV